MRSRRRPSDCALSFKKRRKKTAGTPAVALTAALLTVGFTVTMGGCVTRENNSFWTTDPTAESDSSDSSEVAVEVTEEKTASKEKFGEIDTKERPRKSPAQREPSEDETPEASSEQTEAVTSAAIYNTTTAAPIEINVNSFYESETPILVNRKNAVPADYEPDLVEMADGFRLNRKAALAWEQMQSAALRDGVSLVVISAYRSYEKQQTNFDNLLASYINSGIAYEDAYEMTAMWIAVPGTSEHQMGLAVDINSSDSSFENTAAFKWLQENCAKYGFILRYRKDKVDITKINYEPWHYRYVGTNHATVIMENGWSLEEYLEQY